MTPMDYTFNYTVFSLLTTGSLTSLWTVLETWVLRDGFRCPLLGATEELFPFRLLTRAQGQAWSGGSTSLLRADSCKDSLGWRARSPRPGPQPAFPGSLLLAGAAVSVFGCLPPPPRSLGDFYFLGFCQFQKIGKQLGSRGLGVEFEQWCSNPEKWHEGTWGRGGWESPWAGGGRRARRPVTLFTETWLPHTRSGARFSKTVLLKSLSFLPTLQSLPSWGVHMWWLEILYRKNTKIPFWLFHMLGKVESGPIRLFFFHPIGILL